MEALTIGGFSEVSTAIEAHTTDGFSPAVSTKITLYRPFFTNIMICGVLLSIAGVPGNVLTVGAYFKHAKLHNPTNLLILSQTIGDLLTCLLSFLFFVLNYTEAGLVMISSNKYLCLLSLGSIMMALQISSTNVLALSTERFIAVFYPFKYYTWVTDVKVTVGVVMIWSTVLLFNLLPFFGWETWTPEGYCRATQVYSPVYSQCIYLLPCALCLVLSAFENILVGGMTFKKQRPVVPVGGDDQPEARAAPKVEFRVTKMLLQVVGIFYLSWLPPIVTTVLILNSPLSWKRDGIPEWYVALNEWSKPLILLNAIANPFIYASKNIHYKTAYCKLLGIKIVPEAH
ncbi:hypothetical protein CAPTEDRAFT_192441 [Capitella teleta]|uniref:G-protein coupled receptors family 1 profile domain-containing protein n=1 Tax=Capitella teleta TaxID=283909 RepID=R7VJ38_CAPTE|nr:hypothetical protein CAPTEDRAFT_192441 [Capitella teleta]|eukprot:ELU16331.1 hypothetical protein CAPTEDRAFT_192441 [Capitella teleta]